MHIKENILEAIGNTPLIKLNRITEGVKAEIFVKPEFLNPGGSIKDRIGLAMIEAAEKDGSLRPNGTIIEATAGNTGVGLALVAAIKGYRCIFVMPDKMSQDKVNLLKAYGAEVIITPTSVPPDSPESYNGVADRLAQEIPNSFRPNQFANPNNPNAHYQTTGPEIWNDTDGKVDVLVASMGTGGTISGTAKYLKEKNPKIIVVGADPEGSILSGDTPKSYKVEGIGEDFIPKTFNRQLVDEMVRVSDKDSFNTARLLARTEGLLVGGSAGTAMAAALKYAQRLTSVKKIVVILPDTGRNYINKFYSDLWMRESGFWQGAQKSSARVGDLLDVKTAVPEIIFLTPKAKLKEAAARMQQHNISQLPIIDERNLIVGSLNEASLMQLLHDGLDFDKQELGPVMGKPMPVLETDTDIAEAYRILMSGANGFVVIKKGLPIAVVTRTDLVNYWIKERRSV